MLTILYKLAKHYMFNTPQSQTFELPDKKHHLKVNRCLTKRKYSK